MQGERFPLTSSDRCFSIEHIETNIIMLGGASYGQQQPQQQGMMPMQQPSVVDAMKSCESNSSAKDDNGNNMRLLPVGYEPGEHDVLCGRGRKCFNHMGNVKFRAIVQSFLPQYSKAVAKLEKSYILSDVVEQVRKNSGIGGFIKKDPDSGRWYEVGDFLAREKTSQAFRDVLHDKYKSSNTAKKKRRQEEQAEKLFRAHSNRSLDTSSVHSVGSSHTGDYMLSDNKLMRRGMMERSDSYGALSGGDDASSHHDDLLGGLGQEIANAGRPSMSGRRQRSLRAVLDIDTNQRSAFQGGNYERTSCPDLFGPSNRSNSGDFGGPPISQIEIVQNNGGGFGFGGGINKSDHDSFGTTDTVGSTSSGQVWQHHSSPNLFGDSQPINQQARPRPQFARQPPNRAARQRLNRDNDGRNLLAGVQQQIGNMGLTDQDPQGTGAPNFGQGGNLLQIPNPNFSAQNNGMMNNMNNTFTGMNLNMNNGMTGGMNNGMNVGMTAGIMPQNALSNSGIHQQMGFGQNNNTNNNPNGGARRKLSEGDGQANLMANLASLGAVDTSDENPFEPVPLRDG